MLGEGGGCDRERGRAEMQHNFLTTMKSLKLADGCKGSQVYAVNPGDKVQQEPRAASVRSKSNHHRSLSSADSYLPYG